LLREESVLHGDRFGLLQIRQRTRKIIGHPLHCREPDPCRATLLVVDGCIECRLIGATRLRHSAEVVQNFTLQAGQRKTVGPIGGDRETALDKL
jgi:hypothetical protein